MKIGYVRVSKEEQNEQLQIDALKHMVVKKYSKRKFLEMKEVLRSDDELVVWDINRLGRTTLELIMLVDDLNKKEFCSKVFHNHLLIQPPKQENSLLNSLLYWPNMNAKD